MFGSAQSTTGDGGRTHRVGSFIVLCGSVRKNPLTRGIGRSIVDLPLSDGTAILDEHLEGAARFAASMGTERLLVRLLSDSESVPPRERDDGGAVECRVELDESPIRGVAGVLADATKDCDPDSYVVVINGSQVFRSPLHELIHSMVRKQADVAMVASADGTPVGLWLIRCAVLQGVRRVGYVDLKEQALPEWLERWKVSVVEHRRAYSFRTRNKPEYLSAVRFHATRSLHSGSVDEDPYREEWERTFAVVEPGAEVARGAIIHDSVVLAGATVGKDAVIVRCVVCPGASVAAGERCVGRVIGPGRAGGGR
jgi:NDP-sugar pyrophosphorylase family protein